MADKRFFTNTYITGSGRINYVNSDRLIEDPLFTSFTFDIDFITSPLFYTIGDYGNADRTGISTQIENALTNMYDTNMRFDNGYDILPVMSSEVLDGGKLGFGLQQNVYMDKPLYGATEYIYMVDKRNGGESQNDVRYSGDGDASSIGQNSYKLGDSIDTIVNESDYLWAQQQRDMCESQYMAAVAILDNPDVKEEHKANQEAVDNLKGQCETQSKTSLKVRYVWNGETVEEDIGEKDEATIAKELESFKQMDVEFNNFKQRIVNWGNDKLTLYKNNAQEIFDNNACAKAIFAYGGQQSNYLETIVNDYGKDFLETHLFDDPESFAEKIITVLNTLSTSAAGGGGYNSKKADDGMSFLIDRKSGNGEDEIRSSILFANFKDEFKKFGFVGENDTELDIKYRVGTKNEAAPDWANELFSKGGKLDSIAKNYKGDKEMVDLMTAIFFLIEVINETSSSRYYQFTSLMKHLMGMQFNIETSFGQEFETETIKKNRARVEEYQRALNEIREGLYGSENGKVCEKDNATAESTYGQYLEAKDKLENDTMNQAERQSGIAADGMLTFDSMIIEYEEENAHKMTDDDGSGVISDQSANTPTVKEYPAPQTVLDMLGFISGMKKLTMDYPYVIQNITGLDAAYNKHYAIKDPHLGSGDDKITIVCYESLDLRVSSMFNRYLNAVYDRQYRRERVPVNLRRFNCTIYVHDVRNFFFKKSNPRSRIDELTNMYLSVVEFRFYDCEIVPEETGNIFSDISNEAPSEMKKTNFTFTYGNCVVNFVPPSIISKPKKQEENQETEEIAETEDGKRERRNRRRDKKGQE